MYLKKIMELNNVSHWTKDDSKKRKTWLTTTSTRIATSSVWDPPTTVYRTPQLSASGATMTRCSKAPDITIIWSIDRWTCNTTYSVSFSKIMVEIVTEWMNKNNKRRKSNKKFYLRNCACTKQRRPIKRRIEADCMMLREELQALLTGNSLIYVLTC